MRRANKTGRVERHEHYTTMLRGTMETEAWRALPVGAQALYVWLRLEWRGAHANNNGKISLSVRQAAAAMGVTANTAATFFHHLQAKGFVVMTQPAALGVEGHARSATFELTEIPLPGSNVGRKLYAGWSKGHDFPVHRSPSNNPGGRLGKKKTRIKNHDEAVVIFDTKARGLYQK